MQAGIRSPKKGWVDMTFSMDVIECKCAIMNGEYNSFEEKQSF